MRRNVWLEVPVVYVLLLAVERFLAPERPGFFGISPHPYWIGVLLFALRYGLGAGFYAGAISAGAYLSRLWLAGDRFRFDDPEVDLTTSVFAVPSLTEFGRYRLEFEARLRYEIFKDLFFAINLFDSFDSRPPIEGLERNDFGITTSIGWSF